MELPKHENASEGVMCLVQLADADCVDRLNFLSQRTGRKLLVRRWLPDRIHYAASGSF